MCAASTPGGMTMSRLSSLRSVVVGSLGSGPSLRPWMMRFLPETFIEISSAKNPAASISTTILSWDWRQFLTWNRGIRTIIDGDEIARIADSHKSTGDSLQFPIIKAYLEIRDIILVGTGRRVLSRCVNCHVLDVLVLHTCEENGMLRSATRNFVADRPRWAPV